MEYLINRAISRNEVKRDYIKEGVDFVFSQHPEL